MERRLYRSQHNRILLGVCGGLGEYFNIDPVIVRVIAVVLVLATWVAPGIIAYFIMSIIIPLAGSTAATPNDSLKENVGDIKNTATNMGEQFRSAFNGKESQSNPVNVQRPTSTTSASRTAMIILGIIILAIGLLSLLNILLGSFYQYLWPALLIIGGVIIILLVRRRQKN
jgi:phage shock protein C